MMKECWLDGHQREVEACMVGGIVRLYGVIIIITGRAQEGASVDPESGNGVIKDSENGVILVARQRTRWV